MTPQKTPLSDLDKGKVHLIPLGIGSAFTSRFYHSSLLLIVDGRGILVDAPAPLCRIVREISDQSGVDFGLQDFECVILTHLHGDHCNGLEELGFWRKYRTVGHRPRLYLLEELVGPVWDHRLYAAMGPELHATKDPDTNLETYFRVMGTQENEKYDLGIDGLEVEFFRTNHFIPCTGFRLNWKGFKFGYSADTSWLPELIDFLRPCDVVVHETGEGKGHTPFDKLLGLEDELKNKMYITHLQDNFDVENSPIPPLEEGRLYSF